MVFCWVFFNATLIVNLKKSLSKQSNSICPPSLVGKGWLLCVFQLEALFSTAPWAIMEARINERDVFISTRNYPISVLAGQKRENGCPRLSMDIV